MSLSWLWHTLCFCCPCCQREVYHHHQLLAIEDEDADIEARQKRLDCSGRIAEILNASGTSTDIEGAASAIEQLLKLAPSSRVLSVLISKVLNDTRVNLDRKRVFEFLKIVANQLDEAQKRDMAEVFDGFPAGVLGDGDDQKKTRVFINVFEDALQSQAEERIRCAEYSELIEVLSDRIESLLSRVEDVTLRPLLLEALFKHPVPGAAPSASPPSPSSASSVSLSPSTSLSSSTSSLIPAAPPAPPSVASGKVPSVASGKVPSVASGKAHAESSSSTSSLSSSELGLARSDRYRIVLQQILLSKVLPADRGEREVFVGRLFEGTQFLASY